MKRIFVELFNLVVRLTTVFIALPVLWMVEPFWRFRFAPLPEDHIGNLALSPEGYARHIQWQGMPPRTTHVFFAWNPANRQLLEMWKRHLNIIENYLLRRASLVFMPILQRTRFHNNFRPIQDEGLANWFGNPVLNFTEEEEERGRQGLAEMGVGPDDWFVAFHSRDPAYMSKRDTAATTRAHYSIRDSSIEGYIPAMKWISEQGGFALRMGSLVENSLDDVGPRVIDYATKHRSDFMDVYICAKCRFFLGCTAGLCTVPMIFGVPTAIANMAPIGAGDVPGMDALIIPKRLQWCKDGRLLTFPECREMLLLEQPGITFTEYRAYSYYEARGLAWIENSPEDILDLCHDMMDLVEERDPPQIELVRYLQSEFRSLGTKPFGNPIAPRYALKYRSAIIPDEIFTNSRIPE